MAARSSWKGYLKFSLVSVPVKGYSAKSSGGSIPLHQLHAQCHRRIKYKKHCPIHGEVSKDQIVSGFEYSDGQYVVIEPDEIEALRTEADRAVNVDAVLPAGTIDPLYYSDKAYYLVPDGAVGQKPFVLIQKSLADGELEAIAKAVLFGREELVLIRPVENVLQLTALRYETEVTHASSVADEVETPDLSREEQDLTKTLVKAFMKKKVSIADYEDEYIAKLTQLIEAKVAGKEIVTPPETEQPHVINLMDALKKSVAQAGGAAEGGEGKKSKGKMAASARKRAGSARKRKSG
jgi:DNA end-binding protein Ku